MADQVFILSHILNELENQLAKLEWGKLKVCINSEKESKCDVFIDVRAINVDANLYMNVNDKIRKDGKLISRSLPVETTFCIFVSSSDQKKQLNAFGLILQAFRDSRTLDVGDFDWLNNQNSPMTIDSLIEPELSLKLKIQEYWHKERALTLLIKVNSAIDSKTAVDFVEVKNRKVQMEKIEV